MPASAGTGGSALGGASAHVARSAGAGRGPPGPRARRAPRGRQWLGVSRRASTRPRRTDVADVDSYARWSVHPSRRVVASTPYRHGRRAASSSRDAAGMYGSTPPATPTAASRSHRLTSIRPGPAQSSAIGSPARSRSNSERSARIRRPSGTNCAFTAQAPRSRRACCTGAGPRPPPDPVRSRPLQRARPASTGRRGTPPPSPGSRHGSRRPP